MIKNLPIYLKKRTLM